MPYSTNVSPLDFLRRRGASADSADAEDPIASLPRLLRYCCWAHEDQRGLTERLLEDIVTLAPDMESEALSWSMDSLDRASTFAGRLDRAAAESDRPLLRQLADCVRIISVADADACQRDHHRAAQALTRALDDFRVRHADHMLLPVLEMVVLGWALVAVSLSNRGEIRACRVAASMVGHRLQPILRQAMDEDRDRAAAEDEVARETVVGGSEDASTAGEPAFTIRVCDLSKIDSEKRAKIKDLIGPHQHIIGCQVPLALTPDLASARQQLAFEFPYATWVIDRILADLVNKPTMHLKPTLLVGTPGSGKSRIARRIGEVLGLAVWRFDATQSDGAVFGGTARRWHSAEPCHPFLAISRSGTGNPVVLIDELEKAATRQDYGRVWDCLLGFLEPETAGRYPDPALQADIDVSQVSFIATANSLSPLPSPLRDRFRILDFPEPRAEHLDQLLPAVIAEVAREQGLTSEWILPLTGEERAVVSAHWGGGSVRRLRRYVDGLLNARDRVVTCQ